MEHLEFRAMNSDILLAAQGREPEVAAGFGQVRAFIADQEQRLTRFSAQSELAALNHCGGAWFQASESLFALVAESVRLHAETGGLFNPAILPALRQAGYDRSFDQLVDSPAAGTDPGRGDVPGLEQIELDPAAGRIRLPAGMQLDLGGIAKGWIAERAAALLAGFAEACAVSAGGDMYLVGSPSQGSLWRVVVEDPRDPRQALAVLRVGPQTAIATSSVTRRRWTQAGEPRHHLIDPRTGAPAQSPWLSVTVIAERMTRAEALAKALLIAGSQASDQLTNRTPAAVFIAVDRDGSLWGSPGSMELLDVDPESELENERLATAG
jgi:thiamine biosynthesis lipoprotein